MLLILDDNFVRADTATGAANNTTAVGNGWQDVAGGNGQISSNQLKINSPNTFNSPIMRPTAETEAAPRMIAACVIDSGGVSAGIRFGDDGSGNGFLAWVSGGSLHVGFFLGTATVNGVASQAVSVTNGSTYFLQGDVSVAGGTATATAKLFAGTDFLDAPSVSVLVSSGGAAATPLATATTSSSDAPMLAAGHCGLASLNAPSLVSRVLIGDASLGGSASFTVSPTTATTGVNETATATGSGTAWTSGTTFSVTGGTGASISGLSVNVGAQTATFTLTPGSAAGTLTIHDSTDSATATITASATASLAFSTAASIAADDSTGITIAATLAGGAAPYAVGLYRSTTAPFTPPGSGTLAASYSGSSGAISLKDTSPGAGVVFYRLYATDSASGTATSRQSSSQGAILARQSLAPHFHGFGGDSITYGYAGSGTSPDQYFQRYLQAARPLQPAVVNNDAEVGSNSTGWLSSIATVKATFDAAVSAMSPAPSKKFFWYQIGTNDSKPSVNTSVSTYLSNVTTVANTMVAGGYTVILNAPLWVDPAGSITGWDEASNALILQYRDALAGLDNGTTIRAAWLFGPEYFSQNVSLLGDGTHPNDAGYQALGRAWAVEFQRIAYGTSAAGAIDPAEVAAAVWSTILPAEGEAGAFPRDSAGSFLGRNQDYDGIARGGSAQSIQLATTAMDAAQRQIYLVGGTGKDQCRTAVDFNSASKVATVDMAWVTIPDNTTRYLVGPAVTGYRLDLTQPLPDGKAATVGGALHGAWATAWGRITKNLSTRILSLFGWNSQSTPVATFLLDDPLNPTTRTPQ